ncbi:MAG: InlB B-repeat-containing protein, partial [Clostridia bacterium]|nr:InlB B-repeat-containing protein [Clostridia bacterium]
MILKRKMAAILAVVASCCFCFVFGCNTPSTAVKEYKIAFDYAEGAGVLTDLKVKEGDKIGDLPTPTTVPTGYIFAGWKTAEGLIVVNGTTYSFGKDITLKAAYSPETYSITYDVAGGDPLPADSVIAYSISSEEITLPTPTRICYIFLGWKESETSEPIKTLAASTTGNKTFTAAWKVDSFTVTLENETIVKEIVRKKDADGEDVKDANGNYVYIVVDRKIDFTDWADGTTGAKTISIEIGKT